MAGIGVILNPNSRSNSKNPNRVERFGFIVGDKGSCHATKTLEDVGQLAEEFKKRQIEVLGISGGDGTYQLTLTRVVRAYGNTPLPKIALLGGGTMNNVVKCVGIRGTPETVLSRLIYRYHQGGELPTLPLSLLRVNENYGFLFGNGMIYRFISEFNEVENSTQWTAARMLLTAMIHSLLNDKRALQLCRRVDARVLIDGKELGFKNHVTIFGGTVEGLGLGFKALYRARATPSKFHLSGFALPPRQIVWSFPILLMGRPVRSEHWIDAAASKVTIEYQEPQGYMLDGEVYDPVPKVELSIGPTLQIVV